MNDREGRAATLLSLAQDLGDPRRPLAILAEGNVSARLTGKTFLVKASGSMMGTLAEDGLVECESAPLLELFAPKRRADSEVERVLMACRTDQTAKKPSVECLFHAWLLTLPGVEFVGHTHACATTGILCSPRAKAFATRRICPDEVVCCDVESVLVPYTDPGLELARVIRKRTLAFQAKHGRPPRVILLENHGVITLGPTPEAVMAAMLMTEKAATIWTAAAALGGPKFMWARDVARIAGRADEALRRKALRI